MTCQARIIKEYKTKKADCMWPESSYGPTDVGTLPICGGNVVVTLQAIQEPDWGGSYPKINIEAICTKCKCPWWPGRIAWEKEVLYDCWDITKLLDGALCRGD